MQMETEEVIQLLRADAARFEAELAQIDQEEFTRQVLARTVGAGYQPAPRPAEGSPEGP
jgi:CHASE1-domain containing sensor protein